MGESIGIEKISSATADILFEELETVMAKNYNQRKYYESTYEKLVGNKVPFYCLDITGLKWAEIDTKEDLYKAQMIFQ